MAKSLVKRGLQLVKSGLNEQDDARSHSQKKSEDSLKNNNPKGAGGGFSELVEQNGRKHSRSLEEQKGKLLPVQEPVKHLVLRRSLS